MIQNYFKIARRNLTRNKAFSVINILGLALGMASALLIFIWIQDELSIGKQYDNAPNLYRVMEREFSDGKVVADDNTPGLLADELKKQFPEVIHAAGFSWQEGHVLGVGNKTARQTGCYAGPDWFKMYSIPILAGAPATALNAPNSLAISRKLAEIYFGNPEKALGKSIQFDNAVNYQVTAVFENLPANSSDQYEFLLNWQDFLAKNSWMKEWTNAGPKTRFQLRADTDPNKFNDKLKWFLKGRNTDFSKTFYINLFLQPETEAHLYSSFKDGYPNGGRIEYVRLLGVVAVFLLLIAVINFMNLATARSAKRAREVGVRKVVGAGHASLIGQFMSEAMLLTALSLVTALVLVILLLPVFNQLTDKQLLLPWKQPFFWVGLSGLLVVTGFLSGSYPALFLSSLDPIKVLKGAGSLSRLGNGVGAQLFRRGLVVFQFCMSMLLIVGTVVVYRQLQYIQNKNLGYERENLISIPVEGELAKNYPLFKQQLLAMGGIQSVTNMYGGPLGNGSTTEGVSWTGKDPNAAISFNNTAVGYDFAKTLKLKFIGGRDFSQNFATDSSNYLINQAAAKRIGYKDPVGQPLTFWSKPGKIVGVIEDFHFNSLHQPITPLIIRLANEYYGNILIRTQPGQTTVALAGIEKVYKELNPKFPFAYSFVDNEYQKIYRGETVVGTLSTIFALLAIFIACLGLFGLAAFTAEQRIKEIGVRKVLGASVASIVSLLSKDFVKLVFIAIVIASPIAWYVMNQWLQNFAYKIDIDWWVFAFAGLLSLTVALLTISFQSIKAGLMNPVKSLKSE
ncbi:ABC transporter permease [Dyadobacter chenwenxiniae]|uniref:ABC transporter permease n=1 Tax=Dyadobacter chenwenxiniae TaxID=2906456 RepID=A0A9X1PFF2_9BACT|nr:ABC transporter permease [Dyadobacter chenwenxiniae]MCF0060225.1 ABC transporter permease [Dyadobacter chenwenxiniae]UON85962.1 ABC transporter permease [Dyadobacter chenwenxiniae]